jgi:hypothetical protein
MNEGHEMIETKIFTDNLKEFIRALDALELQKSTFGDCLNNIYMKWIRAFQCAFFK